MTRRLTDEERVERDARKKETDHAYYMRTYPTRREGMRAYQAQWRLANRDKERAINKRWRDKLRNEVFAHFGGRCACCGLDDLPFLSIDHINNDGTAHRKAERLRGAGHHVYLWLKKHGYPEGFQVLCYNCNHAKQSYGICPHQSRPSSASLAKT